MTSIRTYALALSAIALMCITLPGCIGTHPNNHPNEVDSAIYDIDKATAIPDIKPIVIIGSGPAGYAAGLYCARENMPAIIFEGNLPGGLLTQTTEVENWPGELSILGKDLMEKLRNHSKHFGVQMIADHVESIDASSWPFKITTENGKTYHAMAIIICTGATPRLLTIPGEKKYWGKGVTTCAVCDAPFFKKLEVVVIGGGDSAVEEAVLLAQFASKVTVLVRKEEMRAAATGQQRLKKYPNIEIQYNKDLVAIEGDGEQVTHVQVLDNSTKTITTVPMNGVFLAIGHTPNSQLVKGIVDLDAHGYIILIDRTQRTSKPGIFAAGDVEDAQYRQAAVASSSGVKAALDAIGFLREIGFTGKLPESSITQNNDPEPVQVMHARELAQFQAALDEHEIVVADFYAQYCPTCMQMLPVIDAVAAAYKDRVHFIKIDTDQTPDIVKKYMVLKVPTLLIFKNGKMAARYNNTMTKKELSDLINTLLEDDQG